MNPEHIVPQLLLRSWPLPRGAGRIIDKLFSGLRFSQSPVVVKTTDGFDIAVDPNELIGRHIYLSGEFDRSIVEILCNFSESGDTLLDIGSNIGYVSASFLNNVPRSTAIAVEPQAAVLKLLERNLQGSPAVIYPYALGDADGEVWFETNKANNGAGRVVSTQAANTIRIETKLPSTMLRELNANKIDLVKIDAEGYEKNIILASIDQFDHLQPRAILFEDSAGDFKEIAASLERIGYRTLGIKKSLTSLSLTDLARPAHDYVAVSTRRAVPAKARDLYNLRLGFQ